ncbi:MAG: FliM/FliN family flagellar motor switch protein [Hypericibacter sp.]
MAEEVGRDVHPAELQELSSSTAAKRGLHWASRKLDLIKDIKVSVSVRLGTADISVSRLFDLREGETLALDAAADAPVDVLVEGKVVARGRIVVVGESFGVELSEILDTDGSV